MDSGLSQVLNGYGFRNRLRGYRGAAFLTGLRDPDQADKSIWNNWLFVAGVNVSASAGLGIGSLVVSASATFVQPSYTASASLSTKFNVDSVATFTQPSYTASATLQTLASLVAVATFTAPTYTATVSQSVGPTTLVASAIHASEVYSASADLSAKSTVIASATFTEASAYVASASLTTKLTLAAVAAFTTVADAAGQYLGQVVCYSQTVVCNRSTVAVY